MSKPVAYNNTGVPTSPDALVPSQSVGIETRRRCRDVGFLGLFLIYWAGMAVVARSALDNGNLGRLLYVFCILFNSFISLLFFMYIARLLCLQLRVTSSYTHCFY